MKKILFQKKILTRSMLGALVCVMFFFCSGFVSEAAEGKVTADTAKIRKEASTDSEVVGSTSKGKTVDIVGAEKDSSGMVWYKVPNGNNTYGYIRSDLIETSDTIEVSESASSSTSSSENTSKPADTVPTSIGEQKATVSQSSVRVRSGASTEHDAVGSLTEGTEITLIGEANDSAGNKWYQIRCESKNMEGYIRSDLITIIESTAGGEGQEGENTEATEGENTEGEGQEAAPQEPAEPVEPEHNDYEIVYNEDQYWFYNNTDSTMMKVDDILNMVNTANENNEKLQNQIKSNKIIVVILAVIIVFLVVAVTILIFKLRDLYYGDYEEEEEEEEEPAPVRKKQRRPVEEEEEPAPIRKKRPVSEDAPVERKERPVRPKSSQDAELQAAEKKQTEKKPAPRKAQNFLLDDDEFEFEFLNMDDKDL